MLRPYWETSRVGKGNPGLKPVPSGVGKWVQLPERVTAPSPEARAVPAIFCLSSADSVKMARAGRRQLIFELWSIVLGVPPPVPGVERRNRDAESGLTCLYEAHALFRGIERPLAEDDQGADVLAYILKPKWFYEYDPHMVSVALKVRVPKDLLFVTYARLDMAAEGVGLRGTVTHWGFVEADKSNRDLPVDFSTRYRKRLW
jgi:hypothetical protein